MVEPVYRTDRAELYAGDALTILPSLPAGTVDLVLVDPPYNSGGRTASERTSRTTREKYVSRSGVQHQLDDFAGDSRDQRAYITWLAIQLAESLRLAVPGASCLVFSDWRQIGATADALQAGGWRYSGVVAWHKPINRPRRGGFAAACEYVLWGSNGPVSPDTNPVCLPGLYSASQPRGNERVHITQKPVALLRQLVLVCRPGGTVLDWCAGSGSTGVAALAEGRRFIGVEITEHYAGQAATRLAEAETAG